ncbi:MAG: hypothetical protein AAFY69_08060 [Pseudomonadota bacterium]
MRIEPDTDFDALLDDAATLRCPHCDVFSRMRLTTAPDWHSLTTIRPARIGVVLDCTACSRPVYLESGRARYAAQAISLDCGFLPVRKPRPRFETRLLPAELRGLVDEGLACYADGHLQAFALVANRITTLATDLKGPNGKLELFNTVTAAAESAGIEAPMRRLCRDILFSMAATDEPPELSPAPAAVLLELLRDMLHQAFIRPGRLHEALRRGDAAEADSA